MKSVTLFVVFSLFIHLSLQIPALVNCPADFVITESMAKGCGVLTCRDAGTITQVGCGTWQCLPEKYIGHKEADNSKVYPDCCGGPICAD